MILQGNVTSNRCLILALVCVMLINAGYAVSAQNRYVGYAGTETGHIEIRNDTLAVVYGGFGLMSSLHYLYKMVPTETPLLLYIVLPTLSITGLISPLPDWILSRTACLGMFPTMKLFCSRQVCHSLKKHGWKTSCLLWAWQLFTMTGSSRAIMISNVCNL